MENSLWEGAVGEALISNLTRRAEGPYLRAEPMFSFFHKQPNELNHANQLNRNILKLMIDNDSTYTETQVIKKRNYYAKNQLFIIVKDSDPNRLYDFAKNKMDNIIVDFNDFELQQLVNSYKNRPNKNINEQIEKKFGIGVSLPKDASLKNNKDNFYFAKRDRSRNELSNAANNADGGTFWIQQGFMFWSTPYIPDSAQMTVENMLKDRDSTLKYNVPGETKGTYMGTEYTEYYDPEGRIFEYQGHKAVEIRGLWIYDGEVFVGGGGPFVQYSILNEAENKIITVCGYVYAPKYDKREYIRELDAVLNTIEMNS